MKCAVCSGEMRKTVSQLELRIGDELYIIKNVPHEYCESCGEKVLDPDVSETIYRLITDKKYSKRIYRLSTLDLRAVS